MSESVYERCQWCGDYYREVYRVPDAVWTEISPKPDGAGLLCIPCADRLARRQGLTLFWEAEVAEFPSIAWADASH